MRLPQYGHVKTRLARDVGNDIALQAYESFVLDMLDMLAKLEPKIVTTIHVVDEPDAVAGWLAQQGREHYEIRPQVGLHLGERMCHAFTWGFARQDARAILIGSDIPHLRKEDAMHALTVLQHAPSVIGPAMDGGYYLIGFQAEHFLPAVFALPQWGTNDVFDNTMKQFHIHGYCPIVVQEYQDVDTWSDYMDVAAMLAPRSRAVMERVYGKK